jgi:hypothetical protein
LASRATSPFWRPVLIDRSTLREAKLHSRSNSALLEFSPLLGRPVASACADVREPAFLRSRSLQRCPSNPRAALARVQLACRQVRSRCRLSFAATAFRSQAFSTSQRLSHRSNFAALFHAATVRDFPPPEVSPHKNRARLPTPLAPLQFVPSSSRRVRSSLVTDGFDDAFQEVLEFAAVPRRLWDPFPHRAPLRPRPLGRTLGFLRRFPVPPGSVGLSRRLGLASSASKPSSSCESVRTTQSCP